MDRQVTRLRHVYSAKLAEQAERFDEMQEHMAEVVKAAGVLTVEERNLLSVAFKNAVGMRRASWRIISSVEQKEKSRASENVTKLIGRQKQKVEAELDEICNGVLSILDEYLIPQTQCDEHESRVFYYKMKGDYYRYICEYSTDEKHKKAVEAAHMAYEEAKNIALKNLQPTHPIHLGLILNYSVFLYEILGVVDVAIEEARGGFDKALADFDAVCEDTYKDSTLIMQLLRDNMTLWSSDLQQSKEADTVNGKKGELDDGKSPQELYSVADCEGGAINDASVGWKPANSEGVISDGIKTGEANAANAVTSDQEVNQPNEGVENMKKEFVQQ